MSVPGSNILLMALSAIARTPVIYYADLGRNTTPTGRDVTNFAAPVTVTDSQAQPVPRNRYQQLGLDYQKNYLTWYVSQQVVDLERDVSGDQITFQGRRWQCKSNTAWFGVDGWNEVTCVDIGNA